MTAEGAAVTYAALAPRRLSPVTGAQVGGAWCSLMVRPKTIAVADGVAQMSGW